MGAFPAPGERRGAVVALPVAQWGSSASVRSWSWWPVWRCFRSVVQEGCGHLCQGPSCPEELGLGSPPPGPQDWSLGTQKWECPRLLSGLVRHLPLPWCLLSPWRSPHRWCRAARPSDGVTRRKKSLGEPWPGSVSGVKRGCGGKERAGRGCRPAPGLLVPSGRALLVPAWCQQLHIRSRAVLAVRAR